MSHNHVYHHHRSTSSTSTASRRARSPSPSPGSPHHTSSLLPPITLPTTALVETIAGGAHYSGVRVEQEEDIIALKKRRTGSVDKPEPHSTLKDHHIALLHDLGELYECRPTLEILQRWWDRDAVFEDPLSKCRGFEELAAQWFAMPKVFSKSQTINTRIMSSTHSPNRLVYSQTQQYTLRVIGRKKIVESIIDIELNEENKIIKFVDRWGGKDLPTRYGALWLRLANAKVTPWFVRVPKRSSQ